jgi:hypothetical protein
MRTYAVDITSLFLKVQNHNIKQAINYSNLFQILSISGKETQIETLLMLKL